MLIYERQAKRQGATCVIGVDEAGRGPLAGPVVVGAVTLMTTVFCERIDDSKKLTAAARRRAFFEIAEKATFGIGVMNEGVVDAINVSAAAALAVDAAIAQLFRCLKGPKPAPRNTMVLLDGRLRCGLGLPSREIVGGDAKSLSIAAASIVAKVYRDRLMEIYDKIYPGYEFGVHKGYGTLKHKGHLRRRGPSPIHRRTFCHENR